jgi:PKD repeat protein
MSTLTLRWVVALIVLCLAQADRLSAQKSWENIPVYNGLQVKNEMLVFSSKAVFDQVYHDLEQRIMQWNADADALPREPTETEPCPEDNEVLFAFARRYPFSSIRSATLLAECQWLESGKDPARFVGHHLVDEILGALFNDRYQLQVGTDIFYVPNDHITFIVENENLQSLRALERGEDPYGLPDVQIRGPEEGCSADFSVNTSPNTSTVGFAFIGQPQAGVTSYFWEFGDGSTSLLPTPIHTYATTGSYNVCLTIKAEGERPCIDRVCKKIEVGASCFPFFLYNETGQPGGICFLPLTQQIPNVVTYKWNFGDGSPESNQPNPCHTFPCDKTYFVSLNIQTASGCSNFITLPVTVDSYGCCASKAKKEDNYYYANNTRRVKYEQKQVQIPLLYYRVVVSMTHYKLNANNKWRKEKANLKLELGGNVFLPTETGCKCNNPFNIAKMDLAFNKKSMSMTKAVGKSFKARKNNEWNAKYFVNSALLTQQVTPVTCD